MNIQTATIGRTLDWYHILKFNISTHKVLRCTLKYMIQWRTGAGGCAVQLLFTIDLPTS